MENMDWLYRIAPWLKDAMGSAGGAPAQTGMFGNGGWPFFGNAGADPATPVSTGMPPTGRGLSDALSNHLFGGAGVNPGSFSGGDLSGKLASLGGFGALGMGSAKSVADSFNSPAADAVGRGRPFANAGFNDPQGNEPSASPGADPTGGRPFANSGFGGMRGFEEGGDPPVGEPSVVGEQGPEVFVPKEPGTVIPNHALPPWLADAMHQMPAPAPQPQQRGPLRSMAAGRQVADWRDRDPDAAMQETKDRWAHIRDNPAETFENLGITGQVLAAALRNASPNAAQAQSAGGKKVKKPEQVTPMDKVMEEQQFLTDKGFYKGDIDGADGPKTQQARKEYQAAQEKLKDQQLREREIAIQEGQVAVGEKQSEADIKGAENEKTRLENEEKKRLADKERKDQGEARLRESEKNLSWYDKMLRAYGPTVGGILGAGAGVATRTGVKKLGDMYQASNAAKAEKMLEGTGGVVTKENLAGRVGATNDWWRKGGAKNEPFVATPAKAPGVAVNPNDATAIKDLFNPSGVSTKGADLAGMSLFGAKGAYAQAHLPEAQAAFEAAKKAVDTDASDVNIEAYQTAKSRLSALETLQKAAIGGGLSYPAYAMAKPRFPIKPPTNVAEAEKLSIENFLREQGAAAEKTARAAATRQANAAKKAANPTPSLQEMAPGAPGPLPANPMRKFDNRGNPINRGESTPSLQELTAPEPIRAHVPRRTRKKAENG